jgi:hypothetical protein
LAEFPLDEHRTVHRTTSTRPRWPRCRASTRHSAS